MRKSILIFLFALLGILSAHAYDFKVDGIYYYTYNEEAIVTSGNEKYSGSVVIPASVTYDGDTYVVTTIGKKAFYQCSGLTSVTIPESVTSIEECAFYGCTSISRPLYSSKMFVYMPTSYSGEYVIPSGIQSIANTAFYECSGLKSVTIPESVTSIGYSAFEGCTGLTSITIPEGVTSIGKSAFYGTSISNPLYTSKRFFYMPPKYKGAYTIPSGIQSITASAFYECTGLTSVMIPKSVDYIGESAFNGCTGLTSVTIPESVDYIGRSAFNGCTSLTSVEWNARQCQDFGWSTEQGNSYNELFRECENITSITFGNQVTHIPAHLCYLWSGLISITLPESVTSIGIEAFGNCTGLTSVNIPEGVREIGVFAFYGTSINSPLYNSKVFAYMPQTYSGEYAIPSGIESIAGGAFYECTGLTSVTIPKSVDYIGTWAFAGCSDLTTVTVLSRKPPYCELEYDYTIFSSYGKLFVPRGCKAAYQSEKEWGKFAIEELPSVGTGMVTINVNDASMGGVTGGGEYEIDEEIKIEAIPNEGYRFVKWDDDKTSNPRILTVEGDITLTAIFAKGTDPTANENAEADNFRVYVQNRTIYLSEDRGLVQVYNVAGQCVYTGHATAIPIQQPGVYILRADGRSRKIIVR